MFTVSTRYFEYIKITKLFKAKLSDLPDNFYLEDGAFWLQSSNTFKKVKCKLSDNVCQDNFFFIVEDEKFSVMVVR